MYWLVRKKAALMINNANKNTFTYAIMNIIITEGIH